MKEIVFDTKWMDGLIDWLTVLRHISATHITVKDTMPELVNVGGALVNNYIYCSQLDRLLFIINSAARAVSKTPCLTHISPVLKFLYWVKIDQRIQYKVLSITYKPLQSRKSSICPMFSRSNQTLALVLLQLSLSNASQFPLESSSHASQFGSTPLFLDLSTSQFHSKLRTHLFHQLVHP